MIQKQGKSWFVFWITLFIKISVVHSKKVMKSDFMFFLSGDAITSPNFKSFMDSDGPFQLSFPDAELEPTKFAINDDSRNFPKETIERLGQGVSHSDRI